MDAKEIKKIMSNYWDMKHPEVDDFVNEILTKSKEEAEQRYDRAVDELRKLPDHKRAVHIEGIPRYLRIASGKEEESKVLKYGKGLDPDKWMKHRDR